MLETLSQWWDFALVFVQQNAHLTAPVVFALGFAESIALVSLFVPSTFLFLGIGAVYSASGGEFWPIWLAGATGAAIGDCLSYGLGRYFKNDVRRIWPISKYPALIPRGQVLFERWGVFSIIIGKFVGGLRPFVPVVAGMLTMPVGLFVLGSVASSLLWAGVFLAPGFGITFLMN
jgi:membrane protein DedA with SNARE-associated domain